MNRRWAKLLLALGFALSILCLPACFGVEEIEEPRTVDISVSYPEGVEEAHIALQIDLAHLKAAGKGSKLIEGSIEHNVASLHPKVTIKGATVKISQGRGMGSVSEGTIKNEWDLHFGTAMPFALDIQATGSLCDWDLGGLPITRLEIFQGGSDATFNFSRPNPRIMTHMEIQTGTAGVKLLNLANANLEELHFGGGASDYLMDFSGDLQRNIDVSVTMNFGSITLVIPPDIPAAITWHSELGSSIDTDFNFTKQRSDKKRGDLYTNKAWLDGIEPRVDITMRFTRSQVHIRSKLPEEN